MADTAVNRAIAQRCVAYMQRQNIRLNTESMTEEDVGAAGKRIMTD